MTTVPASGMNSHDKWPGAPTRIAGTYRSAAFALLIAVLPVRAEVVFSGLDEALETNVRTFSALSTAACDSARWRIERLFRDADKDIGEALQALGYYSPSITKSLAWNPDCWAASFEIEPGEPVLLRDVDVRINGPAATDTVFRSRLTAEPPKQGDVLNHGSYTAYKTAVMRAAANAGYFDADFETARITVDPGTTRADMSLVLLSGPKYEFGDVNFTEGILRRRLLSGYTDIHPGDPYSASAINDMYEALGGSSYFASVSIRTEPLDEINKIVPVNVVLTPAKRHIYSVGGGYTTDNGAHARTGYTNRRINDKGHQLESRLYASNVRSEINASYRWPRDDPRREWFSAVAGIQHEETDTSENDTYKFGLSRSRSVSRAWLETRYVDFEKEDFIVADQVSTSQLVILGTNWETVVGRGLARVNRGYRLNLDLRGASDSVGSDTSFLQLRARAHWIHALSEKTRVLARIRAGFTVKEQFTELPASVRFFTGGDHSVRGYSYESLGTLNADGEVIGGSNVVDGSVEIDYLLRDKWSLAAFVDAGSAFNGSELDLSKGAGLGLRWYSPVGPIRLDFAHPFDDPDNSFRIHVTLGPDL